MWASRWLFDGGRSIERPSHHRKLEIFSPFPAPTFSEKAERLDLELVIDHVYVKKSPQIPTVWGLESFQGMNVPTLGE